MGPRFLDSKLKLATCVKWLVLLCLGFVASIVLASDERSLPTETGFYSNYGDGADPGLSSGWESLSYKAAKHWIYKLEYLDMASIEFNPDNYVSNVPGEPGYNLFHQFDKWDTFEVAAFLSERKHRLDAVYKELSRNFSVRRHALYYRRKRVLSWEAGRMLPDYAIEQAKMNFLRPKLFEEDVAIFETARSISWPELEVRQNKKWVHVIDPPGPAVLELNPINYLSEDPRNAGFNIFAGLAVLTPDEQKEFLRHREQILNKSFEQMLSAFEKREDGLYYGGELVSIWPPRRVPSEEEINEVKLDYLKPLLESEDIMIFHGAKGLVRKDQFAITIDGVIGLNWIRSKLEDGLYKVLPWYRPGRNHSGLTMGPSLKLVYDKTAKALYFDMGVRTFVGDQAYIMAPGFEGSFYWFPGIASGSGYFDHLAPSSKQSLKLGSLLNDKFSLYAYSGSKIGGMNSLLIMSYYAKHSGSSMTSHHAILPPSMSFPPFISTFNTYRSRQTNASGATFCIKLGDGTCERLDKILDEEKITKYARRRKEAMIRALEGGKNILNTCTERLLGLFPPRK